MTKKITSLFIACFSVFVASAQLQSSGVSITDDMNKVFFEPNSPKRSIQNPKSCKVDTVEFPRYHGTAYYTINVSQGRSLGQLYSCPQPITLTGFTFYAFVASVPPSPKKMNLICNVYNAGSDSLPTGSPLRSDTITIDSTFGGGLLSKIEKHASWQAITLNSNYIITVETDSTSLSAGVVTNSYQNRDGQRFNLNCGSISGLWYNGRNLNIGGVPFDADILLHPHVKYNFGTDFVIQSQCYNFNDTVRFINQSKSNMCGSRMYNRYLNFGATSYEYLCHQWNTGNFFGNQYSIDNKVKYTTKDNYQIRLISTVYGYRGNNSGCVDTTIKQLNFKPNLPGISGSTNICAGDTLKITALTSDPNVNFNWYNAKAPNVLINNTASFNPGPLYASDTFLVRITNNGCVSSLRTVTVATNSYPQTLSVLNDSVCAGSKANLKAVADIGTINWFTQSTGGTPFFTGTVYQTKLLNKDTTFYVEANNGQCVMSPRVKVEALVGANFAPQAPLMSNDTSICLSGSSTVVFNANAGSGLTVRWFSNASGGTPINIGNMYTYVPSKREVISFYADAFNGVCGSSREPVTLTVDDFPTISKIFNDTICLGDSAHLSLTLPFGKADWYDDATNGQLVFTGLKNTFLPNADAEFFIQTRSGQCESPFRTPVHVLVNNFPGFKKLWGDTICAKNTAKLTAVLDGPGDVIWYEFDTGSTVLSNNLQYTTQILNGSKKYFASTKNEGCFGPRIEVQPTVKSVPFSGFSFEVLTFQQVKVSPINSVGSRVFWDFDDGFTSTQNTVTHRYDVPDIYNIKLVLTSNLNQCKDSTIIPVSVTESGLAFKTSLPTFSMYPNPVTEQLNLILNDNSANASIQIYNLTGALVLETQADEFAKCQINLSNLQAGVYVVKVNNYQASVFIKQ
jgi:hypothetical protein